MSLSKKLIFVFVLAFMAVSVTAFASTFTIMQSEAPLTMDPANHSATYTAATLDPMYETLTRFDRNMDIKPLLATDWQISDQAKTWTFTIRKGVKFHDGSTMDASAVKQSFDRVMDPANGLARRTRLTSVIKSVEVKGPYTVVFHLKDSYPGFLNILSSGSASIISPEAITKGGDYLARHVDGTGPYTFVQWDSGEKVVMEKNPDYWGEVPQVDQLVWKWSAEDSVRVMAVQSGDVDVIYPVPPTFNKVLQAASNVNVEQGPSVVYFWVALNTLQEELQDKRVRQALNYAVDHKALIHAVLNDCGTVANSPVGPNLFGYDPDCPAYNYNLDKAKELLAEAGYPDGFTLPIATQANDVNVIEALQGMWSKIGVKTEIKQMEFGVWADEVFKGKETNKGYSVIASWSSYDASGYLESLFTTGKFAPKGANLGFYSNKKVDQLLDEAATTVDQDKRKQLYYKAQRIIQDDAAHVALYYPNNILAMNKRVGNVYVRPDGELMLQNPKINQ